MASKKILDSIPERVFLAGISLILLLSVFILFYGFYPGGLCHDTVSMIHHGVTGNFTNNDPPILQILAGLAYSIYPNQSPLLFTQLAGYFLGIFLIAFYFVKIRKRMVAIIVMLLSWFPYNIFLHAMVIKDVALMVVWLNIFALSINSTIISEKRFRLFILIINSVLLLFGVLVRDNSFTATPALLFLVLYGYDTELLKIKSWPAKAAIAVSSLLLAFFLMQGINGLFLSDKLGTRDYKKSYFTEQLFKYDLIGMSVLGGHNGITSMLNKKEQKYIEHLYNICPIFWSVKIDKKFFEKDRDKFAEWKTTVLYHPLLYIRHRFHIFTKTFGDYAFSQLMWVSQAQAGVIQKNMLSFDGTPPDKFCTPRSHINNVLFRNVRSYLEWYFNRIGSALPFALVGILMMLHGLYIVYVKKQNIPAVKIIYLVNFAAFLYYIPYLFFVHHSETRYVYPSIVLIILTMPFYFTFYVFKSSRTT